MLTRTTKRLLSLALCVCMILGLADWPTLTVHAAPIDIGDAASTLEIKFNDQPAGGYVYTGSPIHPSVAVYYDGISISANVDITYGGNLSGPTTSSSQAEIIVTAKAGDPSYTGTKTFNFDIGARPIAGSNSTVKADPIPTQYYRGKSDPIVTLSSSDIVLEDTELVYTLVENVDYTITSYTNNTNGPGNATVVLTGMGSYTGRLNVPFVIAQKTLDQVTVAPIPDIPYDGMVHNDLVLSLFNDITGETLTQPNDYKIGYSSTPQSTGAHSIKIEGQSNSAYEGTSKTATFYITKDISSGGMEYAIPNQKYTGTEVKPGAGALTLKHTAENKTLNFNQHYIIVGYENNIEPEVISGDKAYVIVEGIREGGFVGQLKIPFTILPADIEDVKGDIKITTERSIYDGANQEPEIEVKYKDVVLQKGSDYSVLYDSNNVNAGKGKLTVVFNGGFSGEIEHEFNIEKKSLADDDGSITTALDWNGVSNVFTGSKIEPKIKITYHTANNGSFDVPDSSYLPTYSNNIKAGTDTASVTATAFTNSNYSDSVSVKFSIAQKSIIGADVGEINSGIAITYTGSEIKPVPVIKVDDEILTHNRDFKIEYEDNIEAGTAKFTIIGMGNYGDSLLPKTFQIGRMDISLNSVIKLNIPDQPYTGRNISPGVTLRYNGMTLSNVLDKDYSIVYGANQIDVGIVDVTVSGHGNYDGVYTTSFKIIPRLLENRYLRVEGLTDRIYDGTPQTLDRFSNLNIFYENEAENIYLTLSMDADYTPTYLNHVEIGLATVTLNGINNFDDKVNLTFKILGSLDNHDNTKIDPVPDQTYTGSQIKPEPVVKFEGEELQKNVDFVYEYDVNLDVTDIGTVKIKAKEGGYYTGEREVYFNIVQKDLGDTDDFTVSISQEQFNGLSVPVIPNVSMKYGSNQMIEGYMNEPDTDFYSIYTNNYNAGIETAWVTFYGQGNYKGSTTKRFTILPRDITDDGNTTFVDVDNIVDLIYKGEPELKQNESIMNVVFDKPLVGFNNVALINETDFIFDYENNKKVGDAKLLVKGRNNYTGTVKKDFLIQGDIEDITFEQIADLVYTGSDLEPKPEITYNQGIMVDVQLVENTDFIFTYSHNRDAAKKDDPVYSRPTVTVTGTGYYTNSQSKTFTILPKDLSTDREGIEFVGLVEDGYEYTRFNIEPPFTIENHGNLLKLDDGIISDPDYKINGYANNLNVPKKDAAPEDQPYIIIEGTGRNYTGVYHLPFIINPRKINSGTVTVVAKNEDETITYNLDGNDKFDFISREDFITFDKVKVLYNEEDLSQTELVLGEVDENGEVPDGTDYSIEYIDNNRIGKATMRINGHGNYGYEEPYDLYFKIMGNISNPDYTELKEIPPQYYAGNVVGRGARPEIELIVDGKTLVVDEDINVDYFNNTKLSMKDDVDPPTVKIEGTGEYYTGDRSAAFNIIQRNLSDEEKGMEGIEVLDIDPAGYQYTGDYITPSFRLNNNGEEMIPGVDYEFDYHENKDAFGPTPYISITGINEKYTGTAKIEFIIRGRELTNQAIQNIPDQEFTGFDIEPKPTVTMTVQGEVKTLTENVDYEIVKYTNNKDVASSTVGESAPCVYIKGINNFDGEVYKRFSIVRKDISNDSDTDYFKVTVKGNNVYYGGNVVPELSITRFYKGQTVELELGTDYEVSAGTNCINAGDANVNIKGIGNYNGTRLEAFQIQPRNVNELVEDGGEEIPIFTLSTIENAVFNGMAIEPAVTVKYFNPVTKTSTDLSPQTNGAQNYVISYAKNVNAGMASALVKGEGNFTGTTDVNFEILPKSLEDADIPVFEFESAYSHTGYAINPLPSNILIYNGYELKSGVDYEVIGTENIKPGTANYTIQGKGNFKDSLTGSFKINGDLANAQIKAITMQQHTGAEIKPELEVTFYGDVLTVDADFEVQYSNNINMGKATATITGKDGSYYAGTNAVDFIISDDFTADLNVVGIASNYLYTGSSIQPIPAIVSVYGEMLVYGKDYQLTYKNNTNVGTAMMTVSGIGQYKGDKEISFQILPKSIARVSVSNLSNQIYNGKAMTPVPKVVDGTATLVKDRDYTVVYVNNQRPGTATVIINGKGNYTGSKNSYFSIGISQVTGFKSTASSTSKVTLSWTKLPSVTGYEVYNSGNKLMTKTKTNKCTISNMNSTKTYKYKVRAYVIKDGTITFGKFSSIIQASSKPKAPSITVTSTKKKQAAIKWKKITGVNGYEVYQSTSKNGKYSRVANTTKTSYTKTKLTSNKTYYYKVRAYKTINGKKVYSAYSSVKYKKIK